MLWIILLWGCRPHHRGRQLLQQGRLLQVLEQVRPVEPEAFWLRACALWRLGRLKEARKELQVGLAVDEDSVEGHRMLGLLWLRLGHEGAALHHLQRALQLCDGLPRVKKNVVKLLLRRAALRLDTRVGLLQAKEVEQDLQQVLALEPRSRTEACALRARARRMKVPLKTFAERRVLLSAGGRGGAACAGPPKDLPDALNRGGIVGRCGLQDPGRFLRELRQRHLLVGCFGAQTALRLEAHGCLSSAREIWDAMHQEAGSDPRWSLLLARNLLLQGQRAGAAKMLAQTLASRADMFLEHTIHASPERAEALLSVARVLSVTGHPRKAARKAVEAMVFATSLDQNLRAITRINAAGLKDQAREASRLVLEKSWGRPRAEIEALNSHSLSHQ